MAVTTRDTVDIIRDIVASMTPNITIDEATDNLDGTYTLKTSNTYWLRPVKNVLIGSKKYQIVSFVINESITIKDVTTGAGIPVVTSFPLPAPNFFHGATVPASDQQSKEKSAALKTPFIWLYERLDEKPILDVFSRWGRESNPRLFFMDEADSKNQYAPDQKFSVTDPMRQMVELLIDVINNEPSLYKEIEDYNSTAIANWGQFTTDKGNADRFFSQDLSGQLLNLELTTTKQACSKEALILSGCSLSVDVAVCPVTTIGGSDGTAEAFPCGNTDSVTYEWNDPLSQTTKKAVGLSQGNYQVIATDTGVSGCTTIGSGVVEGPGAPPSCNLLITDMESTRPSVFGASDGTATATITGGAGPLSYFWSNGETTNPATGLTSGLVSLSVLDTLAGSCHKTDFVTVDIGMAYSFYTKESGSTLFSHTGDGTAIWTDGVDTLVGDSVTFNFSDSTEKKVTVYGDPSLITALSSLYFHGGKVTNDMDISNLVNLTGYLYLYNNDDTNFSVNFPTTSSLITRVKIDSCAELTSIDISGITSSALSFITIASNPKLTSFTGGVSSGPITSFLANSNTIQTELDISGYTGLSNTIRFENTSIETLTLPVTSGAFTLIYGNSANLSSGDFSNLGNISGDFRVYSNTNCSSWSFPSSTGSFSRFDIGSCDSGYVDLTVFSGMMSEDGSGIYVDDMSLTTAEVNRMLVEAYAHVSSEGAGGDYTGRVYAIQNNSAPDGSSGGYDGDQAVIDLVAKGVTVTTD